MAKRKRKEPKITTLKINTSSRTVSDMHGCNFCGETDGLHGPTCVYAPKPQINSYEEGKRSLYDYWSKIAEAHDCESLTDAFVQLTHLREDKGALENRCKVAEDLNKVYIRMYLELQEKFDRVVEICSDSVL